MRRLLRYARPFAGWILLAIALLFFITGAELARPYLVKVAIDDHLLNFDEPWIAFAPGDEPTAGVRWEDVVLVREGELPEGTPGPRYQIVLADGDRGRDYYLIEGVVADPEAPRELLTDGGRFRLRAGSDTYAAHPLNSEQLRALRGDQIAAITRLAWIFFGVIALGFVLSYAQVYVLHYTGLRIVYDIREDIFSHLQRMPFQFFDRNPVGRLVTRVSKDTETLDEMFTNVLVNLFKDIFLLIGILIVMFTVHWQLALVSLAVMPIVAVVTVIFRSKAREAYRLVRVRLARINANLAENIAGMRITQIFNQEKRQKRLFERINTAHFNAMMQELRVFAFFRPSVEFLSSLALAIIIWYGGGRVVRDSLDFGVLYLFIQYMQTFFRPINDLTEKYNIMQSAMASSERIFMILDTPREEESEDALPLPSVEGAIEFDDVSFAYIEENWVLKDVSFRVEPGETVALVGATGAGK